MVSDGDLGPEQLIAYKIEQSLTRFVQVLNLERFCSIYFTPLREH